MSAPQEEAAAFIRDIRRFGKHKLGLYFGRSFINVSEEDCFTHWLYISYPYEIKSLISGRRPYIFSRSKKELLAKKLEYESAGFDTHIFSAEMNGGGGSDITPALLVRDRAAQAIDIFHEGWHTTLPHREQYDISYDLEEASASLAGTMSALRFSESIGDEGLKKDILHWQEVWFEFCTFINWAIGELTNAFNSCPASSQDRAKMKDAVMMRILEAASTTNAMSPYMDNLGSNAFFLRCRDYTAYYPLMLETHKALGSDIKKTMQFILALPTRKAYALRRLRRVAEGKSYPKLWLSPRS